MYAIETNHILKTNHSVPGNKVNVQGIPISQAILNIPGRVSNAAFDILFLAKDVPPLGFKSYYLSPTGGVVDYTNDSKPKPTKVLSIP